MTLLLTVIAAIVTTIVWYMSEHRDDYRLATLARIYWGASLMWLVDACFEYAELKAAYFTPASADMINDAFLGITVIALGLIIWLVILMIHDPKKLIVKK